jgi:lysozyme family protein
MGHDEIYKKKYWTGGRCDDLPSGVDYVMFDGSVNSGVASAKWLQRALSITVDGHMGTGPCSPRTMSTRQA